MIHEEEDLNAIRAWMGSQSKPNNCLVYTAWFGLNLGLRSFIRRTAAWRIEDKGEGCHWRKIGENRIVIGAYTRVERWLELEKEYDNMFLSQRKKSIHFYNATYNIKHTCLRRKCSGSVVLIVANWNYFIIHANGRSGLLAIGGLTFSAYSIILESLARTIRKDVCHAIWL